MDPLAVKPVPIRLYSYDYDGELKVRGIPRAEPAEVIRLLFEPEGVSPSDLAKWKVDHANIVKLPWLKAQLDLHGGDNPTSLTKDECLKRLRDRVLRPDVSMIYAHEKNKIKWCINAFLTVRHVVLSCFSHEPLSRGKG